MGIVTPSHHQHYPDQLLPHRLEEYVLDDGSPPTWNRTYAKRVTGKQALDAIVQAQQRLGLTNIDPRYFVGTCFHEAGCSNEWDTEVATASDPAGFVSVGAYQISQEEVTKYGYTLEDMLDLDKSSECMVKLAEYNRQQIRVAAKLAPDAPDPDYTSPDGTVWNGGALRAYLAISHNHGNGYMRATVAHYGLDWPGFKSRNPNDNIIAHGYGEDAVTGGPYWPNANNDVPPAPGSRILKLTSPYMTGEDVRELQRHLKVRPDGVYGPETEAIVIAVQSAHSLLIDGEVGPATWAVVLAA